MKYKYFFNKNFFLKYVKILICLKENNLINYNIHNKINLVFFALI